jgi:acyl dehydratase
MEPIFEDIKEGDVVINLIKPSITKLQLVRYAGASGDFNPLHIDDEVGRAAGFDGVVAHGMLMMGIAAQAITNWIPKSYLKKFKVRFKGPTKPGDVIKVIGKVTDKKIERKKGIVSCTLEVVDQHRDVKISGSFEATLSLKK